MSKQPKATITKLQYPPGIRLELIEMNDPHAPVPAGTRGTVELVDAMGTIHMKWDNGRTLGLVPGEDEFRKLSQQEIAEENKMTISSVTVEELRRMPDREGLILQGCGGDLNEWVNGVNKMLAEGKILKNGTQFRNVQTFQRDGMTNLLFPFEKDVSIDLGKLAVWRISTNKQFGSVWLSDYVPNYLGGYEKQSEEPTHKKPDCPLIGQDGNIFNLMGIASRTLRENGLAQEAKEMCQRITKADSYGAALNIIGEYVNITSIDDMDENWDNSMHME